MSHNKILGAAIVAALSVGGGTAQAEDPTFGIMVGATAMPQTIALELFDKAADADTTTTLPCNASTFKSEYALNGLGSGVDGNIIEDITVTYTLTGGTWESHPLAPNFKLDPPNPAPSLSYEVVTNTQVTYGIKASSTPISGNTTLVFDDFRIQTPEAEFAALMDDGSARKVELTIAVTFSGGTTANATETLVKNGRVLSTAFAANNEPNSQYMVIDVGESGRKFKIGANEAGAAPATLANLGTMKLTVSNMMGCDLTNAWTPAGDANKAAKLVITNGPFAASTAANRVFLDTNSDDGICNNADIPATATKVTETRAEWATSTLGNAQLDGLIDKTSNICVTVAANNTTEINETENAPQATLTVNYDDGHQKGVLYPSGTLSHIKKNGIICQVYNVTDNTKPDFTNIRVTNRSDRNGTLTFSLRDMVGETKFDSVPMQKVVNFETGETQAVESITPNQTIRFTSHDLTKTANDVAFGRGVLTIGSDLVNMEVFALLRNQSVGGSNPLLNLSVGASGNGCD